MFFPWLRYTIVSYTKERDECSTEFLKTREKTDSPMSLDCRPLPSEFHSSSATIKGDTSLLAWKLRNEKIVDERAKNDGQENGLEKFGLAVFRYLAVYDANWIRI